jgi:hypothetical protein
MPAAGPVFHLVPDLDSGHAFSNHGVRAGLRPVRSLSNSKRWFDELRYTTHAFEPTVHQWARIQASALGSAFRLLQAETVHQVALQLSFSAVQRELETLVRLVADNCLLCHRLTVMLCGSPGHAMAARPVRAFVEFLRGYYVSVGFRVFSPRLTMEMPSIDLCEPDFLWIPAPHSGRVDYWVDTLQQVPTIGVARDWTIVGCLDQPLQRALAREAGFGFGQGDAVAAPYVPRRPHYGHEILFASFEDGGVDRL